MDRNTFKIRIAPVDCVALRKESVDRNIQTLILLMDRLSRSPQGERG